MTERARELYIVDQSGRKPVVLKRFPVGDLGAVAIHRLEQKIRAEHAIDDEIVFLRDSDNDVAR